MDQEVFRFCRHVLAQQHQPCFEDVGTPASTAWKALQKSTGAMRPSFPPKHLQSVFRDEQETTSRFDKENKRPSAEVLEQQSQFLKAQLRLHGPCHSRDLKGFEERNPLGEGCPRLLLRVFGACLGPSQPRLVASKLLKTWRGATPRRLIEPPCFHKGLA